MNPVKQEDPVKQEEKGIYVIFITCVYTLPKWPKQISAKMFNCTVGAVGAAGYSRCSWLQ